MLRKVQMLAGSQDIHFGGWAKQSIDPRDANYSIKLNGKLSARPPMADLRSICTPVQEQGPLGSCTAHMFAALVEANENRRLQTNQRENLQSFNSTSASVTISNVSVAPDGSITYTTKIVPPTLTPTPNPTPPPAPTPAPPTPPLVRASRLFEYYATRKILNTVSIDSGATIRDSIKAGAKYGVVHESLYPYNVGKFAINPPQNIWTTAARHKVTSYHAINDGDIETMKVVLSEPIPFLIGFGFMVYPSFLTRKMAQTGLLVRPSPTETIQGGHAVVLVGYDDTKVMPDGSTGAFLVRNSWGVNWGLGGYFWMAQNYVADPSLCSDFWVVKSAPL